MEASLPYWFGDTKYSTCTLIGQEESLKTFEKSSLDNFYATWYHPDRQAVVVVGDIDVDRIEAKIKEYFGRIPKCDNPPADPEIPFPSNEEPVVGIVTDPETTAPSIDVIWKSEAQPEELNATIIGEMTQLVKIIIGHAMDERFTDITSKPGAPYLSGYFGVSNLIYDKVDAAMGSVTLREDNILEGYRAFFTELERLRRYGITDAEFDRAKADILAMEEAAEKRASTRKNPEFIRPILNNFFDNTTFMEPSMEKQLVEMLLGQLNAGIINQMVPQLMTEENQVIIYSGPAKDGIATPTEQQILGIMAEVRDSEVPPPAGEEVASEFLDPSKLKDGKVKKTAPAVYGSTKWTLSNGVEVYLLPTDYRKDQIMFNLWRDGGKSRIADADLPSFDSNIISLFQQNCGVAGFSGTQVKKMLTGKNLSVNPYIATLTNGIQGNSSKKDLETAFQLIYLLYTQPRFDPEEYQVGLDQLKAMLPGMMENPQYKLQKDLYKTLYGGNPRLDIISPEIVEKADIATVERVYKQLFDNAAGLKFTIVGDFDPDEVKPLIEKYIGSIKKGKKAPVWTDRKEDFVKGVTEVTMPTKMETPMSTAAIVYHAPMAYTAANDAALDAVSYIMDMRYTASLREEIGGTYGASAPTRLSDLPKEQGMIQIVFQCKPELCDTLVYTAKKQFEEFAAEGPTPEEFNMTKLNLQKNIPENRQGNGYWQNLIKEYVMNPVEYDKAYEEAVNNLTPGQIQAAAKALLAGGNKIEFIQIPE